MAKQADLPGMENRKIKELHEAAEEFLDASEKAKRASEKKKLSGEALAKIMRRLKREVYRCNGIEVHVLSGDDKVKVKEIHDEEGAKEQKQAEKEAAKAESKGTVN